MIIEEVSSSKAHEAIVMHVSPCPCSSKIKRKKDENQLDEDWSSDNNRLAESTR
jgi:hypothetical protein